MDIENLPDMLRVDEAAAVLRISRSRAYDEVEGVLIDHDYHDGRFWDQRLIAVHRKRWSQARRDHLDILFQTPNESGRSLQDAVS